MIHLYVSNDMSAQPTEWIHVSLFFCFSYLIKFS